MTYKNTEDGYFFQKDRELIESRKNEEIKQIKEQFLQSEGSTCTSCGGSMKSKDLDGIEYKYCTSCATVNLSLDSLNQLYKENKFPRFKFTIDKQKERNDLLHSFEEVG